MKKFSTVIGWRNIGQSSLRFFSDLLTADFIISFAFLTVVTTYWKPGIEGVSSSFSWLLYFTIAVTAALLCNNIARKNFNELSLLKSKESYNFFILLAIILLTLKLLLSLDRIEFIVKSIINALYSYPKPRDELYKIRNLFFDGTLEYSYLIAMGSVLLPFNLKTRHKSVLLASLIPVLFIGAVETITQSRYFCPSLIITSLIMLRIIVLNQKVFRMGLINVYLIACLAIFLIALSPILIRSYSYKQITFLSADSATMFHGVNMREDQSKSINSISLSLPPQAVRRIWNTNKPNDSSHNVDRLKLLNDFKCSTIYGPYFENKFCTGYMHKWLNNLNKNYYYGAAGPVLPTYKYWQYGGWTVCCLISANLLLLITPLWLVLSPLKLNSIFLKAWIVACPLFITKVISFFRGDPLHAGINYIWFYSFCILVVAFSNRHSYCRFVSFIRSKS
jgi:hypothetical protein